MFDLNVSKRPRTSDVFGTTTIILAIHCNTRNNDLVNTMMSEPWLLDSNHAGNISSILLAIVHISMDHTMTPILSFPYFVLKVMSTFLWLEYIWTNIELLTPSYSLEIFHDWVLWGACNKHNSFRMDMPLETFLLDLNQQHYYRFSICNSSFQVTRMPMCNALNVMFAEILAIPRCCVS